MNLSVYMPEDLIQKMKVAAAADHRSVSQFIRMAILQKLNEVKK